MELGSVATSESGELEAAEVAVAVGEGIFNIGQRVGAFAGFVDGGSEGVVGGQEAIILPAIAAEGD